MFNALPAAENRGAAGGGFVEVPLDLADVDLFDLGVVDVNADGWLDIFTTNHSERQSLLVNQAGLTFQDKLTDVHLDHNPHFPGWENSMAAPTIVAPGLYVYREGHEFIVEWKAESSSESVSGRLELLTFVTLGEQTNVVVTVTEESHPSAPVLTTVEFSATGDARLAVDPEAIALPLTVTIDAELPVTRIFVGPNESVPREHVFTLLLRDRHGMAWASFDHDEAIELFVSRGGLSGMSEYVNVVEDELFQNRNVRFRDITEISGIEKGSCRGRKVRWIDLDRDGRLDLFVACQSDAPQFWLGVARNQFSDVSNVMAAAGVQVNELIWIDVDGDLVAELVTFAGGELTVYEHDGLGPLTVRQTVSPPFSISAPRRFALADYDRDGDPDLFLSSETNNTLFINEAGSFEAVQATSLGLPQTSATANWVDYDNDGVVDLHLIPQGLFRQQPDHTFVAVPITELQFSAPVKLGWATWFDYNNDGARDVVAHVRRSGSTEHRFLRNEEATGHWLEVELTSIVGNHQAIGAVVQVISASGTQTQWVGQSEGSRYSQGHYRLYFGLGDDPAADTVRVTWPDGSIQELGRSAVDEIIRMTGPSGVGVVELEETNNGGFEVKPNPFNPSATISFDVAEASITRLVVYDALGREVARLVDGMMEAGRHEVRFDASNLPSGVYFAHFTAGSGFAQTLRLTLLK